MRAAFVIQVQRMTRTIAYLRVSTDKQADRSVSLDAQRAKVAAYAELYDLQLAEVIVDAGESAKSLDRLGLQPPTESSAALQIVKKLLSMGLDAAGRPSGRRTVNSRGST